MRRTLDAYSHTWDVTRTAACARGEEELLSQRMACLGARLAQVDALLRSLMPGEEARVERAPFAVEALPSSASCMKPVGTASGVVPADAVVLDAWALWALGLPEEGLRRLSSAAGAVLGTEGATSARDESAASGVRDSDASARTRHEIVRAIALGTEAAKGSGDETARPVVLDTEAAARTLDERAPVGARGTEAAARALDARAPAGVRDTEAATRTRDDGASGRAAGAGASAIARDLVAAVDPVGRALIRARLEAARSGPNAESLSVEAGRLAEASRDDASAARAWTLAMHLVGNPPEQASRAQQWRERASAALARLGGDDELEGVLAVEVARLFSHQDRLGEAAQQLALALPRLERRFGAEGFEVAHARAELGAVRRAQGRYAEALGLYERALGTVRGALGPDHPEVARLRLEQAETRVRERDFAQAERLSLGALAVLERALGTEHPRLEDALARVAAVLEQEGRAEEAKPYRERLARLRAHP
ncbi:tetratricopeptide repeat protein [Myxococcaceae bacterium JPH2]|nr:tetratricopeptide repeat protein [Myxococcaceae bacterium JPH2]